jgi:autotransporter translocation and assembly factor TamB
MLQRRMAPAKRYLRRTVQVVALVGTLIIGIIALALIVSQTPLFHDWLRKYVVRQAGQYVNGTVSIGSLGGNLFYGVQLGDIAVDFNGERIITLKQVEIKYSLAELASQGVTIRQIRLDEPYVMARRDAAGWNLAKMVKKQEQEANRRGPRKSLSLPDIEIVNGHAAIDDRAPSSDYRYPSRIDGLNVKAGFEYAPVHYSLTLDRFAFVGKAPDLTVRNLAGRIGTRDDDLNVEKLFLQTAQSSVTIDGVLHNYLTTPSLQLTASAPAFSMPEFAGVLPSLSGYNLHPSFDVKADGLVASLRLGLNVRSEAGTASGTVTADLKTPDLGVRGDVSVQHLDLAPILKSPARRSDITGHAKVDLSVASGSGAAVDRLRGHVVFDGPSVTAEGYHATNVRAVTDIKGRRVALDARVNAYGGSATAKGFITAPKAAGDPTVFDLTGSAAHINLASLPPNANAPRIATDLNPTAYHVTGSVARTTTVEGSATMARSTIAGGTILSGTTGEFALTLRSGQPGLQTLTYAARGDVRDMNLRKIGDAFQIASIAKPEYDSRINTRFDVKRSGATVAATRIDASGTATNSEIFGGRVPQVEYEVHLVNGPTAIQSLTYTARGDVRDLNLRRIGETFQIAALSKPEYDSRITTHFDVKGSGTTLDRIGLDATGTLVDAKMYGGTLPRMAYDAHLANGTLSGRATGEFRDLDPAQIFGSPRLRGKASGTVDARFSVKDPSAPITPDGIAADGRLTLTPSEIGGLKIDAADIQGQYAARRGTLRQATVKGPDLEASASGPIALDQSGQSNVTYHVAATNLGSLGRLADQPGLAGSAILDGVVTGNAASLKTVGTLDGSKLAYQNNKALDLNGTYTVTMPDLDLARAVVQAQSTATFVQVGGIQINTLTATTNYANRTLDFQAHLAEAPSGGLAVGQSAGGARELDATGTVIFHPDHQELHLPSLALRTQGVEWKNAPGSSPTVKYGNNEVQVQGLKLVNSDQALDVDGRFSLGDHPEIGGIDVHARNVDIAQLEKLTLQNRGFSGKLDADAKISGNVTTPVVTGHVAVAGGGFQQFKYQSLTADATYTNGRIGVDARLVQTPGAELTAKGTLPMSALRPNPPGVEGHAEAGSGEAIDLRIQSTRMDLGIVQGFTRELTNVVGTVQADVHVTGSGTDPHVGGYVDVQNGGFGVAQAGVKFSGMTTRIELQEDRVHVPRFQILDQHGKPLTISGDLAFHEGQAGAVNVALESDDFKIIDNELGNVHLESHLKLTGEVRHPRLVGEVRADAARIEIDRLLLLFANPYSEEAMPDVLSAQESVTSAKGADEATRDALAKGRQVSAENAPRQNATAPETPAPQTGVFSALEMDVHLIAADNLVVRGTDLRPGGPNASQVGSVNATLGVDVQVRKGENGPVTLRGTASTVRGFYEFQGRRFTVNRGGTLQFHGLPQVNPDVDVTAERLIPNTGVTAKIHITGTARAPQIALTSTPPLDEADILSLIVFNRSVNELGTGERASLAETASGIASGFLASSLGKSIGKALDVDLFEITTSDDVTGETAGGVTLGKQIGDKAFVRFRQQFGQRSFTEFMLEYQLATFLRLETRLSPETSGVANRLTQHRVERAGLDLIFFFSY